MNNAPAKSSSNRGGVSSTPTGVGPYQRLFEQLFEEMHDGVAIHEIICDDSGKPCDYRFLAVNPAFEDMTGLRGRDIVGRTVREIMPNIEPIWIERYGNVAMTGKPVSFEEYNQALGKWYYITAYCNAPGQFASLSMDITERKKQEDIRRSLEQQLVQGQKMQAIGTLAGGIAHDFNNLLTVILGHAELLRGYIESWEAEESINAIMNSSTRASELISKILAYSRQTERDKKPTYLQPLLQEAAGLLKGTLPPTIRLKINIQPNVRPVFGDANRILQVIMNLCTNAYHAMQVFAENPASSGRDCALGIRLREVPLRGENISPFMELHSGLYAKITISDTGKGMSKETRERIFDPYFTTREKEQGTGLGLAMVHGIVEDHKGFIRAHSRLNEGSQFDVYLPLLEEADNAEKESSFGENVVPDKQSRVYRILLIDDDTLVSDVIVKSLQRFHCQVTCCLNGFSALDEFRRSPKDFDVILTDMTMPEISGLELSRELLDIRPDIPVVLCTGHVEPEVQEKAAAIGIQKVVQKPIVGAKLFNVLKSVIQP